jgi:hypothetical protein
MEYKEIRHVSRTYEVLVVIYIIISISSFVDHFQYSLSCSSTLLALGLKF